MIRFVGFFIGSEHYFLTYSNFLVVNIVSLTYQELLKRGASQLKQQLKTPGKVRIVGGKWRGTKLEVGDFEQLRPTPDRVRETLFNWLQGTIEGSICLDLFAGCGALGIEAASRGAEKIVLIEQNISLIKVLQHKIQDLHANEIEVVHADAIKWLEATQINFDLVFLDPPFGATLVSTVCEILSHKSILRPGAVVYVETGSEQVVDSKNFQIIKQSRAGQVQYMLLEHIRD